MQVDWGAGQYESTAEQLQPAAEAAVARAAVQPGEHVVDLGCGTGNSALLLAAPGVRVTGVDPAPRLLEVARARAEAGSLDVRFVRGDAASIPLGDGDADVIVSVFAVIFAPDPTAAVAEMARVLAPDGRIVLTAWLPRGAIVEMTATLGGAVREVLGVPEPQAPAHAWHDPASLEATFGPFGFEVGLEELSLAYTAPSVDDYMASELRNHPMAIQAVPILEKAGRLDEVQERLRAILAAGNEDPSRFRVTSPYVVVTARRPQSP